MLFFALLNCCRARKDPGRDAVLLLKCLCVVIMFVCCYYVCVLLLKFLCVIEEVMHE